MAKIQMDTVTAATVYLDNNSFCGSATEISGLTIKNAMKEHSAVGMIGVKKLWVGFEAMQIDVTWDFFKEAVTDQFGDYNLKIYGNVSRRENGTPRNLPVYMEMRCRVDDNDVMGSLKPQDWSGQKVTFTVDYIYIRHDNKDKLKIDIDKNIYEKDGVDMLAEMKKNANL